MISRDCEKCSFLDKDNKKYPCKLDHPLRCSILYAWLKHERKYKGVNYL